ncbi:MAG: peptidoglycan bridge formation glycyltransferase FemA/FemB family protein [Paludibacteraceae bacterium]|nr:peptidoglycan bridge formation glycyltransferase FemA/FemB family protein [Paludibacteraceae bacterium]
MIEIFSDYKDINKDSWNTLVQKSSTSTWFQTPEAYLFFASLPNIFTSFIYSVTNDKVLKGVCIGYITKERNALKQFLTRRAIIIGGPMLANDICAEELTALLKAITHNLKNKAIFIETRNFNDYSKWKQLFRQNDFDYSPHLNFQVDTSSIEIMQSNLSKNKMRDIKASLKKGTEFVANPTIDDIKSFYNILCHLYKTKVKTPLFPFEFFERLYYTKDAIYRLIRYENRIVGGTLCIGKKGAPLYEWFACGADKIYKNIFPSTVATYSGLVYAATQEHPIFDMMGAGKPNENYGVRDFKAKFGGKLVEYGRFQSIISPLLYKVGFIGVKILKIAHS